MEVIIITNLLTQVGGEKNETEQSLFLAEIINCYMDLDLGPGFTKKYVTCEMEYLSCRLLKSSNERQKQHMPFVYNKYSVKTDFYIFSLRYAMV